MFRYKLILEFDGAPFVGWQRQDNGPSVQAALEAAGRAMCSGGEAVAVAAGRTDAGVHALAMSAHIDLPKEFAADKVRDGLNFHLRPAPIAVLSADLAPADFHARFSCIGRAYEYRLVTRRAHLSLEAGRAWRISRTLDVEAMHEAAQGFVGQHDFTTFRASACQAASPVKTLSEFVVSRDKEHIFLRCAAKSFLHNQVRSMVGSLVEVGLGKWGTGDIQSALAAKDRQYCGPVAPAEGLYFLRADYPALTSNSN